ncbi:MAG: GatB/YqeY domain-containing protein [Alphaproteobacteria bacterium]
MSLRQKIMDGLKSAMLAKQERATATLRMVVAKLRERDIEARPSGNMDGIGAAEILSMLEGMVKQRRESIALYEKGNRPELAQQESEEITIIESFMPQKLSPDEVSKIIAATVAAVGAKDIKDMGKVMNELKSKYAGQMDFAQVGALVKSQLGKAA